jgi:hypothetical protein
MLRAPGFGGCDGKCRYSATAATARPRAPEKAGPSAAVAVTIAYRAGCTMRTYYWYVLPARIMTFDMFPILCRNEPGVIISTRWSRRLTPKRQRY